MLFNAVNGKGPCGSQFCALQSYPRPILTHWRDRASPMNADCWANIPWRTHTSLGATTRPLGGRFISPPDFGNGRNPRHINSKEKPPREQRSTATADDGEVPPLLNLSWTR